MLIILQDDKGKSFAVIERDNGFRETLLKDVRHDIRKEVEELLPRHFKFSRMGAPVSTKQEENLMLKQVTLLVKSTSEDQDEDVYKLTLTKLKTFYVNNID